MKAKHFSMQMPSLLSTFESFQIATVFMCIIPGLVDPKMKLFIEDAWSCKLLPFALCCRVIVLVILYILSRLRAVRFLQSGRLMGSETSGVFFFFVWFVSIPVIFINTSIRIHYLHLFSRIGLTGISGRDFVLHSHVSAPVAWRPVVPNRRYTNGWKISISHI